jgi:hypothetical protein
MRQILKSSFLAGLLFLPASAFASVQITEIMYDTPGSDSGREWIEVTNTGADTADLSKYKLFEANTNHKLVIVVGTSTLAPQASAIIASDPAKFKEDWPQFSGAIFDSTFSLSNTGETLSIKNASSSVLDSASYTSDVGAAGDGGTLHRSGDDFIAALPNPGVYPGEIKSVPKVAKATPAPVVKKVASAKTSSYKPLAAIAGASASYASAPSTDIDTLPTIYWILGFIALAALSIAGAVYTYLSMRESPSLFNETTLKKEEFSIIEN